MLGLWGRWPEIIIQTTCQSHFSGLYLVFEVFQRKSIQGNTGGALSRFTAVYLNFEACGAPLVLPCSRKNAVAHVVCENVCPLQGSFGPFGPKVGKRVRKWVPRASRPRRPKSRKRSRKRVKIDCFQLFWLFFDSVFDLLGPGAERPRELIFGLFFQLWAQRAQMTPVAGPGNPNMWFYRKGRKPSTLWKLECYDVRPLGCPSYCAKPLPEDLGDEILLFLPPPPSVKNSVDFWWLIFFRIFPRKNGLKFVTPKTSENFTTSSTARKEIYDLALALGATSRNKLLPLGTSLTKKIRENP